MCNSKKYFMSQKYFFLWRTKNVKIFTKSVKRRRILGDFLEPQTKNAKNCKFCGFSTPRKKDVKSLQANQSFCVQ